jgi:SulP family sulfate permease
MFSLYFQKRANIKDDILSGLTVALALIPEAVAFSFVAGVQPLVGLYAAFIVGFITAVMAGLLLHTLLYLPLLASWNP